MGRRYQLRTTIYIITALFLILSLSACQINASTNVEVPDVVDVRVEGIDGLGVAEPVLLPDGERMVLGLTQKEFETYQLDPELIRLEKGDRFTGREELLDSLEVTLSPSTNLSNGDIVTLNVETNTEVWSELGIDLKLFPWQVLVKNLTSLQSISLSEGLVLTTEGYNGSGTATVSNPSLPADLADCVTYRPSRTRGLANGETVRITMSVNEDLLAQKGMKPYDLSPVDLRVEGLTELQPLELAAHITLQFEGFDGQGTAHLLSRGIPKDLIDKIEYRITPDAGLANGDRVHVTALYDADRLHTEGYSVTTDEIVLDVSGLHEWETLDPFAGVQVRTEGVSGSGRVSLVQNQLQPKLEGLVDFEIAQASGLANGDSVTVTVDADRDELQARGIRLSSLEKDYTITGLQEWPVSLEDYDLEAFMTRLDPLIFGMIDQRILVPNRWQPNRTQSTWETQTETQLVSMHYVWETVKPESNYMALVYEIDISGRITNHRRGVLESYNRTSRASNTVYMTVRVPSLVFNDGSISEYKPPNFLALDDSLAEALQDAIGTANTASMQVLRVSLGE